MGAPHRHMDLHQQAMEQEKGAAFLKWEPPPFPPARERKPSKPSSLSIFLSIIAGCFFGLGIVSVYLGFAPAIVQMFGSAMACIWGVWLFREKGE